MWLKAVVVLSNSCQVNFHSFTLYFRCYRNLHIPAGQQPLLRTSISHGQSFYNQSWVGQLTLSWGPRVRRAEVEVVGEGAVVWGEGPTQRGAPARPLALRLHRLGSLCKCKVRGVPGLACGRRAIPLPCLNLSQITPISTSPLAQSAGDGVCDVSWRGGIAHRGRRGGQRDRRTQAAPLGSCRARHTHPFPLHSLLPPLPLVPAEGPLLQDGFQVVPEATLWAVVAAGGQFGNLERRIGLSITAPLNGLQLAADAVHGVVATTGLRRVIVHAADGRAAVLASWLEERLKSEGREAENIFFICMQSW